MTPEEARTEAENNFYNGYNCAQSVLKVFCKELNIPENTALLMAQSFGGGTCRLREMCGTVSGMLMALGFYKGSLDPKDKNAKDELYKDGQELVAKFKEQNGSYICKELLANAGKCIKNGAGPTSDERTSEYYKKRPCPKLCGDSAAIFAEYLKNNK